MLFLSVRICRIFSPCALRKMQPISLHWPRRGRKWLCHGSQNTFWKKNISWKLSTPTNAVLTESDGVDKQIECVRFAQFQRARIVVRHPIRILLYSKPIKSAKWNGRWFSNTPPWTCETWEWNEFKRRFSNTRIEKTEHDLSNIVLGCCIHLVILVVQVFQNTGR